MILLSCVDLNNISFRASHTSCLSLSYISIMWQWDDALFTLKLQLLHYTILLR